MLLFILYDITEDKIKNNPADEDKFITNYINLIMENKSSKVNYKPSIRSSIFKDDDSSPIDIKIHNNFQKYNRNNNYDDFNQSFIPPSTSSMSEPITTYTFNPPMPEPTTPLTPSTPLIQEPSPPSQAPATPATPAAQFRDYKDLREGFKAYYAFNR